MTDNLGTAAAPLVRRVAVSSEQYAPLWHWNSGKPCRLYDSRTGPKLQTGVMREVTITPGAPCTIPQGTKAMILNIVAWDANGEGYLRAWGSGTEPDTSVLNFVAATPRANNATIHFANDQDLKLHLKPTLFTTPGEMHVIVDVIGFYGGTTGPSPACGPGTWCGPLMFQTIPQCRALDSRSLGRQDPSTTRTFTLTNVCGLTPALRPSLALSMNMHVFNPAGTGNIVAYDSAYAAADVSTVSSINYQDGRTVANGVVTRVGSRTDGAHDLAITNRQGTVDVIADVTGYFAQSSAITDGSLFYPIRPCRALDTRRPEYGQNKLTTQVPMTIQIAGNCGVPRGARAAVITANIVRPQDNGYLRLYPSNQSMPVPSVLDFRANDVLASTTIMELGTAQKDLTVWAWIFGTNPAATSDLVIDVLGYFAPPAPTVRITPASVAGGKSATGTVTVDVASPGAQVSLSSNAAAATVPSTINIPAGASSALFNVATTPVSNPVNATIAATVLGQTRNTVLSVVPAPALASITLQPSSVIGGNPSTGTVQLVSAAPDGGADVALSSNSATAVVPPTVSVPAGATSATFTVTTTQVSTRLTAQITARLNSSTRTASLMIETPNNTAPSASFFFNCTGLTCAFDASASTDPEGQPLTYNWLLGSTSIGSGATMSYTFASSGTFNVTLQVTDNIGSAASPLVRRVAVTSELSSPLFHWNSGKPCRIYDSRLVGAGAKIPSGTTVQVSIAGSPCTFPAGTRALVMILNAFQPTAEGYVKVWGVGTEPVSVSLIFNPAVDPQSGGATVQLAASGSQSFSLKPTVFAPSGTPAETHFIVDVVGVYADPATPAASCAERGWCGPLGFKPLTQCRLFDSRVTPPRFEPTDGGGRVGITRTLTASGTCGVNSLLQSAMALSMSASAIPLVSGNFLVYDSAYAPADVTDVATMSYKANRNEAVGTITRAGSRSDDAHELALSARWGTTDLVLDVNGVFATPQLMADGLAFYPVPPCRAVDTRYPEFGQGGKAVNGQQKQVQIAGNCGIPRGARAVVAYSSVIGPTATGYLKLYPAGTATPLPPLVLFQAADFPRGNNTIIELGTPQKDLTLLPTTFGTDPNASMDVVIDVFGYFAPAGAQ